jgi:hypothetical protein
MLLFSSFVRLEAVLEGFGGNEGEKFSRFGGGDSA